MTGSQIFAVVWGLFAIGLGYLFARYPKFMQRQYEAQLRQTPLIGRELSPAQRRRTIVFYRVVGMVFIAVGIGVAIAAAIGSLK